MKGAVSEADRGFVPVSRPWLPFGRELAPEATEGFAPVQALVVSRENPSAPVYALGHLPSEGEAKTRAGPQDGGRAPLHRGALFPLRGDEGPLSVAYGDSSPPQADGEGAPVPRPP